MLKPLTSRTRKRHRGLHRQTMRLLFAAMHYLRTSRDGAVIAQIVGVEPVDLYQWSQKAYWIDAIRYWQPDYKGDGILEGEYFKSVVGDSMVERSLQRAERLWKALVDGRDTYDLREVLRSFDPRVEREIRSLLRYEKIDFTECSGGNHES